MLRRRQIRERQRIAKRQLRLGSPSSTERDSEKGYRVVSVSLYSDQAELVDRAAESLLHGGYVKANRSLVIQTAIQRLREDLEGKSPTEVVKYFLERQVRRPLAHADRRTEAVSGEVAKRGRSAAASE